MSRRHRSDEVEIGSDSFLDVIANIVGILIILIVIVGMRVRSMPFTINLDAAEVNVLGAESDELPSADSTPPEVQAASAIDVAPVEPAATDSKAGPIIDDAEPVRREPSAELVALARSLKQEIIELDTHHAADREKSLAAEEELEKLRAQIQAAMKTVGEKTEALKESGEKLSALDSALPEARERYIRLRRDLGQAEREMPGAQQIRHKLTPISRIVQGPEVHFRVSEGKVAYVPIPEMMQELGKQVERRKEWLMKNQSHQGVIGPIRGFSLHYLVERENGTALSDLRAGRGMVRIQVSRWQLQPEKDLDAETADEALTTGSEFQRQLLGADPESNLTFWVYPDSFAAFRKLQSAAQAEGFSVAARPLPAGIPIAGSPNGSRSAGQ